MIAPYSYKVKKKKWLEQIYLSVKCLKKSIPLISQVWVSSLKLNWPSVLHTPNALCQLVTYNLKWKFHILYLSKTSIYDICICYSKNIPHMCSLSISISFLRVHLTSPHTLVYLTRSLSGETLWCVKFLQFFNPLRTCDLNWFYLFIFFLVSAPVLR